MPRLCGDLSPPRSRAGEAAEPSVLFKMNSELSAVGMAGLPAPPTPALVSGDKHGLAQCCLTLAICSSLQQPDGCPGQCPSLNRHWVSESPMELMLEMLDSQTSLSGDRGG